MAFFSSHNHIQEFLLCSCHDPWEVLFGQHWFKLCDQNWAPDEPRCVPRAKEQKHCRQKLGVRIEVQKRLKRYLSRDPHIVWTIGFWKFATMITTTKEEEILRLLNAPVVDLWKLREYALSTGGLVNGKFFLSIFQMMVLCHHSPSNPFPHNY